MDLITLKKRYNIEKGTLKEIRNFFNQKGFQRWFEACQKNPYELMSSKGWGFARCDKIAEKIGFDMNSDLRMLSSVQYIIEETSTGDTILMLTDVLKKMSELLGRTDVRFMLTKIKEHMDSYGYILFDKDLNKNNDFPMYITSKNWYLSERAVWEMCQRAIKNNVVDIDRVNNAINFVMKNLEFPLNKKQELAFRNIPNNKLNVLTGHGGTGKSYTTRAILDVLDFLGEDYVLLAPTGCAVKVLSNSTKRYGMTIHRRFYTLDEEITAKWLIIDECSMLSLEHIRLLKKMIGKNSPKLLLIGDINQLTPIGAGSPFRDVISLIESGIIAGTVTHLTEIMRSSDELAIAHLSTMFTSSGKFDKSQVFKKHKGVQFIPIDKENFTEQVKDLIKTNHFKLEDTFVLSPFNIRSFGTGVINETIQNEFNNNVVIFQNKFKNYKVGDILMHTKNNTAMNIYNGERVRLESVEYVRDDSGEQKAMYRCTRVDEQTSIVYDEKTLSEQTMLSYSISIHKSQGSSLENVILVVDSSHIFSLNRNSIYTGMSRASKELIVLYDLKALIIGASKNETIKTKTFLKEIVNLKRRK